MIHYLNIICFILLGMCGAIVVTSFNINYDQQLIESHVIDFEVENDVEIEIEDIALVTDYIIDYLNHRDEPIYSLIVDNGDQKLTSPPPEQK